MKYVVVGGGTGGHVTPIRHVATSLKSLQPECDITFIGQRGDRFAALITDEQVERSRHIFAGKWRRYNRPLWQELLDIPTLLLNIRDVFFVLFGYFQSLLYLLGNRPNAIFIKGGYVGVPVGMAAATLRIPVVTHDSDMIPGLANRIVGRWATVNAVASEEGEYPYSADKLKVVGVPIDPTFFKKHSENDLKKARERIGAGDNPVVLVFGGSLGAKAINDAISSVASEVMTENIEVFHFAGESHVTEVADAVSDKINEHLYHAYGFIDDIDLIIDHYAVADVVISRAGATSVAEIAAQAKASIIIPGQQLADQQVNAEKLDVKEAAIILHDDEISESPHKLLEAVDLVLRDEELKHKLSKNITAWAHKNAAQDLAKLTIEAGNG